MCRREMDQIETTCFKGTPLMETAYRPDDHGHMLFI